MIVQNIKSKWDSLTTGKQILIVAGTAGLAGAAIWLISKKAKPKEQTTTVM
jgi:hypothetical protein